MSNFYSSLVINSKKFANAHRLFKPRYNKEYFKRVTANLAQLEEHIKQRSKYPDPYLDPKQLKDLKENSSKLVKLKDQLEKLNTEDVRHQETLEQLEKIEDRLMPTVVSIPNRSSKLVPPRDTIVDEIKTDFQARQNLVKVLSHRKLSYINNCYSKSVVGPNSHYYFGIGAKLQHALTSYFTQCLEREKFVPLSGLCMTRSAVVEAVNSRDGKSYFDDPARIIENNSKYTCTHLNESSRESLVGFITTLGPISSNNPLRLMTSGSSYRLASDWFDGDDKRISQSETVHALSLNSSIEQYSMMEYEKVCNLIWSSYKRLELPTRLVHCSASSMLMNEYDAHRVDIWLPSRQDWLQVGRVSHYLDYITIRVGMKRGHIIDSMVYDGQALIAAIIENRQTALGKFILPNILNDHLLHLTQAEADNYLGGQNQPAGINYKDLAPRAQVMTNHEQRRYLVKKNYLFGHSKKSRGIQARKHGPSAKLTMLSIFVFLCIWFDWHAFWCDWLPNGLRAFLYDNVRIPARRFWFSIICEPDNIPVDKTYAEIDKSRYALTSSERQHEALATSRNRPMPTKQRAE